MLAHRRSLALLALALALVLWGVAALTFLRRSPHAGYPKLPAHRAVAAATFRDSVGVNVHLSYGSTAYGDFGAVQAALRRLGVRQVRDGACAACRAEVSRLEALGRSGVHATLIAGNPRNSTGTLGANLALVRTRLRGVVTALEGPNEYDRSGDPNWVAALRAYQGSLYRAVKADPALRRLPVIGPSFGTSGGPAQVGDLSASMDLGNLHSYPGGQPPAANLEAQFALAAKVSGRRPLVATETGYHDALHSPAGHPPVDPATAAAYVPQLFLEYFLHGVRRTFLYELVDEKPETGFTNLQQHFGLLRDDWTPKPAYESLRALLAGIGDGTPADGPGTLKYAVTGAPADLRQLLVERGDGSFALVLWRAARVWDPNARRRVAASADQVRVRLGQPVASAAVAGGGTLDNPRTVPVRVGAQPVVVRLRPSS
jgi:hypothetical protein